MKLNGEIMKYSKKQKKRIAIFSSLGIFVLGLIVAGAIFLINFLTHEPNLRTWVCREENFSYSFESNGMLIAQFNNAPIPVLETQHNGKLDGQYSIDKKEKTISITVNYYNKKLTKKYSYEIKKGILCLKNLEDGQTLTFNKQKN